MIGELNSMKGTEEHDWKHMGLDNYPNIFYPFTLFNKFILLKH